MADINNGRVSLKEYFCQRIDALDVKITTILEMNQEAVDKAEKTVNTRLEGMNEFRNQLSAQATTFVTKKEVELIVDRIDGEIKKLEINKALLEGKASQQSLTITAIISLLGLLTGFASLALNLIR